MFPKEQNPRIERVKFALRSTGVKPEAANPLRSGIHSRGYLPHVKREGARYFVTFRLADSLPKEFLLKIQGERAGALQRYHTQREAAAALRSPPPPVDALNQIELEYRRKIERYLDRGLGACWLKRPEIAGLVAGALRHFDGQRYLLHDWVVMPNHVHTVFWPMANESVSGIVQSWKRHTAREANKLLQRTGNSFWQPEAFDHWIRNDAEHARCCRYVRNNPVTAGLCATPEDWPWSSAWKGCASAGS